jgi:predicted dehydrogenase
MPPRARNTLQQRSNDIQHLLQGGLLQSLRVAAVGVGWVSQNRHLPAILRRPEYELVGVVDVDGERAQEVASLHGILYAVTDRLSEVDWLDTVDAIVIGAPAPSHGDLIAQALACNKHVITEKPFVTSIAEGERLAATAQRAGRVLAVVQSFQFTRAFACLQRDMASGRLGELFNLLSVQLSHPRRRPPAWMEGMPGGQFFEESPHLLCLARRLLPGVELEQVKVTPSSWGASTPKEVYSQLRNHRGQGATLLMRFEAAVNEWHVTLSTEQGTANIDMYRDIYLFIPGQVREAREGLNRSIQVMGGPLWGSLTGGPMQARSRLGFGYDEVFARFAAAIRSGTLQPEHIGAADALAVLRLQQEILGAGRIPGALHTTARSQPGAPEWAPMPPLSAHLH